MATRDDLTAFCHQTLNADAFRDYCPNGLQIEGKNTIQHIVTGVTACQAFIDQAIKAEADLCLVHHGFFWKGESPCLTGIKARRIHSLLSTQTSLLAYHLPLDAHPILGNNAQLAKQLGLTLQGPLATGDDPAIAFVATLQNPMTPTEFGNHITQCTGRKPQMLAHGQKKIRKIGLCTGAAQDFISHAADAGLDAYLSGEISERTVHLAREYNLPYFAAGHHATERYGIQALGSLLAEHFEIKHTFIDVDNPV